MKAFKFFALFAIALMTVTVVPAQIVTRKPSTKDSTTPGTKYITFTSTVNSIVGIQTSAVKDTGTVAGYAILETRIDTINANSWVQVKNRLGTYDTFKLTNTSYQTFLWPLVENQYGNGYRVKYVTTGGRVYIYTAHLRR